MQGIRTRLTIAVALAIASLPAAAQSRPDAELYIDVATHAMPGMPDMGLLGRMTGAQKAAYGMTRYPGMPGQYLDVALDNRVQPATPAAQAVPKGLQVGERIDLLPPDRPAKAPDGTPFAGGGVVDGNGKFRVLYFWGCGAAAGAGQPREFTMEIRNGVPVAGGSMVEPRKVAQRGIPAERPYVLWPNAKARKTVRDGASLVGDHHVTGPGVPASMRFALARQHDFMPKLAVASDGADAPTLRWQGVDGAKAYFIHGTMAGGEDTIVMWSSAGDAYAGPELFDFLGNGQIDQWVRSRTLLPADARSCQVPREVAAAAGGMPPMLQMIAYGGESTLSEPRPADAPRDWAPDWHVRVRTKSTAMVMPGMAGMDAADTAEEKAPSAKDLLKGLFRR